jgi:hypothetical protein
MLFPTPHFRIAIATRFVRAAGMSAAVRLLLKLPIGCLA